MRKLMVATAALAVAALAVPAAAQPYPDDRYDVFDRRFGELRLHIEEGVRRGRIGREEAYSLHDELAHLRSLESLYRRGGLSGWERGDLQRRLVLLRDRIRYVEAYGQQGYDPRYEDNRGWDDRALPDRGWDRPGEPGDYDQPLGEPPEPWREDMPGAQPEDRDWQDRNLPPDDRRWQDDAAPGDGPEQGDDSWDDGDWQADDPDAEVGDDDWEYEPI